MSPLALRFLMEDRHLTELARFYWELDQEEKAFPTKSTCPPQSVISRLFFDTVLGIGDDSFFKAPKDVDPSSLNRDLVAGSI